MPVFLLLATNVSGAFPAASSYSSYYIFWSIMVAAPIIAIATIFIQIKLGGRRKRR